MVAHEGGKHETARSIDWTDSGDVLLTVENQAQRQTKHYALGIRIAGTSSMAASSVISVSYTSLSIMGCQPLCPNRRLAPHAGETESQCESATGDVSTICSWSLAMA